MFNNISWQGYWITLALIAAAYYLVVYLLYFRKDFSIEWRKGFQRGFKSPFSAPASKDRLSRDNPNQQPSLFENSDEFQASETDTIEYAVQACMDEINAYLEEAKRSKCIKEEVLFGLRSILTKYPAISKSGYKDSLTSLVINQCEYLCSVHLNSDDVMGVWVGR